MNTETLHPVTDYIQALFNSLGISEGFAGGLPYFDTANPPRATIGYGFNIEVTDYLLLVLRQMGIVNSTMTTTEINARRNEFTAVIKSTPDGDWQALRTNLNRTASRYGVSSFSINETQGYEVFQNILLGRSEGNIIVLGKQQKLDKLLNYSLDHNSKEYVAVMSLYYNSESLVKSTRCLLANAIINDNRAEAWFEIRYGSNADGQHANRRYEESYLFGLYDNGSTFTEAEAKEVMRMYTRYEILGGGKLSAYESEYPPAPGYANILTDIKPANDWLIANFAMGNTINGWVSVGQGLASYNYLEKGNCADNIAGNINNDLIFGEKGHDILNGSAGNDVIYGGEGNDELIGGLGIDTLIGGTGNDTYVFYESELGSGGSIPDKIIDDGVGDKVVIKNVQGNVVETRTLGGDYYKQSDDTWTKILTWSAGAANQVVTFIYDATQAIGKIILPSAEAYEIPNFQSGDFGINLIDVPDVPVATNTILGDQNPGNLNDILADTAAGDRIEGLTGNDDIHASQGGSDWLVGGDGEDRIISENATGDDILEGNAGSDILWGGSGSDRVFGETSGEMETLISDGETAENVSTRGDLATGGTGNDFVYGSNARDLLFGGDGYDLLVGGAGDDVILGDDEFTYATLDWSFSVVGDPNNAWSHTLWISGIDRISESAYGDDAIYAGTGNDLVIAGGGNDEVYAGAGDDAVFGGAGDDFTEGGDGNDILSGDEYSVPVSAQGNDYIDGGSGDDLMRGDAGDDDDLFGGDGNDTIFGRDGIDRLEGGLGDDYLDGDSLNVNPSPIVYKSFPALKGAFSTGQNFLEVVLFAYNIKLLNSIGAPILLSKSGRFPPVCFSLFSRTGKPEIMVNSSNSAPECLHKEGNASSGTHSQPLVL